MLSSVVEAGCSCKCPNGPCCGYPDCGGDCTCTNTVCSCFTAGTEITLADGTTKNIEDIQVGDEVLSYDVENDVQVAVEIGGTWSGPHDDMYIVNEYIEVTSEHPFWTVEEGWAAISPQMTMDRHGWKPAQLKVGQHFKDVNSDLVEVFSIEENYGEVITYNLLDVGNYNTYYAAGVLVHNKAGCFLPGTLVEMADGSTKAIETVMVGDKIFGYDENTGEYVINEVLEVSVTPRDYYFVVKFDDDTEVRVTDNHPMYVKRDDYEGWASLNPQMTYDETGMPVEHYYIGDMMFNNVGQYIKIVDIIRVDDDVETYNLKRVSRTNTFFAGGVLVHNKGCFLPGTLVEMADGTTKPIENIEIGEMVVGYNTERNEYVVNEVLEVSETPRTYYFIVKFEDGTEVDVTDNHPMYVVRDGYEGWASLNPQATYEETGILAEHYYVGDLMFNKDGKFVRIVDIIRVDENVQTFNLKRVSKTNTFFAGGVLVHNKCCFLPGTGVTLDDGTSVPIEDIEVGDYIRAYNEITGEYTASEVLELESPVREGYYHVLLEDGTELKVTDEHPIYIRSENYEGWGSMDPVATFMDAGLYVKSIQPGYEVQKLTGSWMGIVDIEYIEGEVQTYNLKDVAGSGTFFAEGILVHNKGEEPPPPPPPRCGDGIWQSSTDRSCEYVGPIWNPNGAANACRDNGNGCRSDCTCCGDGIVQSGEQCDDGNTDDTDACGNKCNLPFCGDGAWSYVTDMACEYAANPSIYMDNNPYTGTICETNGQECRDDSFGADACTCCGDSLLNDGEYCDDGNTVSEPNTDSAQCRIDCTFCGDSVLQPQYDEYCDDGNEIDEPNWDIDQCRSDCTFCGDTYLQPEHDETCDYLADDQANNPPGVNCNEEPYNPNCCRQKSFGEDACTFCGDNVLQINVETCDRGGLNDWDENSDGIIGPGECRNDCTFCGDGSYQEEYEFCDPEIQCTGSCSVSDSSTWPDGFNPGCRSDCTACGDGILQPENGEQCDDSREPDYQWYTPLTGDPYYNTCPGSCIQPIYISGSTDECKCGAEICNIEDDNNNCNHCAQHSDDPDLTYYGQLCYNDGGYSIWNLDIDSNGNGVNCDCCIYGQEAACCPTCSPATTPAGLVICDDGVDEGYTWNLVMDIKILDRGILSEVDYPQPPSNGQGTDITAELEDCLDSSSVLMSGFPKYIYIDWSDVTEGLFSGGIDEILFFNSLEFSITYKNTFSIIYLEWYNPDTGSWEPVDGCGPYSSTVRLRETCSLPQEIVQYVQNNIPGNDDVSLRLVVYDEGLVPNN
ncbi:MAG: hypothetical protein KKF44_03515 [Nanoarchaeota archaeon]|nr:hypothetical protein [Nanoarchaeota archaeon]